MQNYFGQSSIGKKEEVLVYALFYVDGFKRTNLFSASKRFILHSSILSIILRVITVIIKITKCETCFL